MTVNTKSADKEKVNWITSIPFILFHLTPLLIIWTGISWFAVGLFAASYAVRMFFVTAGYHRYFAHRTYEMSRIPQFLMALGGTIGVQKGPLWWAAHHRHHHQYSDELEDVHSPIKGFFWSHVGWIVCDKYNPTKFEKIQDFAKYPELRLLNKYSHVPPILFAVALLLLWGPQALVFGFFVSTIALWHVTYSINSLAHKVGGRRYVTNDTSRNFLPLALLTGGEGWHNNHHYFQASAKQGFFWWEIDFSYYVLKFLSLLGIVKNLRKPPKQILHRNRVRDGILDIGMFEEHWRKAATMLDKTKHDTEEYYRIKKEALAQAMESAKYNANDLVIASKRTVSSRGASGSR